MRKSNLRLRLREIRRYLYNKILLTFLNIIFLFLST